MSKKADKAAAEAEAKAKSTENKLASEATKQRRAGDLGYEKEIGQSQGKTLKKSLDIASKVKTLAQNGEPSTGGLMQMQTSEQMESEMRLRIQNEIT